MGSESEVLDELESLALVVESEDTTETTTENEPGHNRTTTETQDDWEPVQPSENAVSWVRQMVVKPALDKFGQRIDVEYPIEVVDRASYTVAALGEKYSIEPPNWVRDWYEELALARVLAGFAWFTWSEFNKEKEKEADGEKTEHQAPE